MARKLWIESAAAFQVYIPFFLDELNVWHEDSLDIFYANITHINLYYVTMVGKLSNAHPQTTFLTQILCNKQTQAMESSTFS